MERGVSQTVLMTDDISADTSKDDLQLIRNAT